MPEPRNRPAAARGARHRELIERYLVHEQHGRRIARLPTWREVDAHLRRHGTYLAGRTIKLYVRQVLDAETELAERIENEV